MNDRNVRGLVSDGGLVGLGLIMQLAGGVMAAFAGGYLGIIMVTLLGSGGRMDAEGGRVVFWIALVLLASLIRSLAHGRAGARLVYGGPGTPAGAFSSYLVAAAVQTGVVGVALVVNDASAKSIAWGVLLLGSWPVALWLVARPSIGRLGDQGPMAGDGGLDGAAILMLVLAATGVGVNAIMFIGWTKMPWDGDVARLKVALLIAIALLSVRTVLQLRAGFGGARSAVAAPTLAAAARYGNFGVTAGLLAGGVFVIALVDALPPAPAEATMVMVALGAMVTWMLLVWPSVVRRFARDRELTALGSSSASPGHAPDRGLPTLGWLLLGLGVFALVTSLGATVLGTDVAGGGGQAGGGAALTRLGATVGNPGEMSKWLGLAVAVLQTWAGYALIHLTPRYRLAGTVYGAAAAAVALYTYLPIVDRLGDQGAAVLGNPLVVMAFATVATGLVVPVATLLLVRRALSDAHEVVETFT